MRDRDPRKLCGYVGPMSGPRRCTSSTRSATRSAGRLYWHRLPPTSGNGSWRRDDHPEALLFPAHDGDHWREDDWRNWRRRIWREVARDGTPPRDLLRSSYITVQVYSGQPLTTVAKWAGTSVAMIDRHYASVIENFDGQVVPAEAQIADARKTVRGSGDHSGATGGATG